MVWIYPSVRANMSFAPSATTPLQQFQQQPRHDAIVDTCVESTSHSERRGASSASAFLATMPSCKHRFTLNTFTANSQFKKPQAPFFWSSLKHSPMEVGTWFDEAPLPPQCVDRHSHSHSEVSKFTDWWFFFFKLWGTFLH